MRWIPFAAALAATVTLSAQPRSKAFFHKGVNFTAEWPDVYRSERAGQLLAELPNYGINAVAIVPYGFARRSEAVVRFGGSRSWENDDSIERIARLAHNRGLKVLLKPQLWVRGSYPGEIRFDSGEERNEWFAQYRLFAEHYARLAQKVHADLFAVGVEFSRMTRYEAEWRSLIGRVREIYHGPLIYAANWGEEFETLRFWDALDYLGLNQYYPLPDDLSMERIVSRIEAVQRRFRRPVIFTEAGFASLEDPQREPWDETPRELSPQAQARCYEAVFQAFYPKPWFRGVYWWKVGTNGYGGPEDGSHTPWGKPAMEVIARWFLSGGR
jgi:hypothetical protein